MSKENKKNRNLFGKFISLVYTAIAILFVVQLFLLDKLPLMYNGIITGVLFLITLGLCFIQFSSKINKTNKLLGKVILCILSVFLVVGNVYIYKTSSAIQNIVEEDPLELLEIQIAVMNDSPLQSISELSKEVGIINIGDGLYVNLVIEQLKKQNSTFTIKNYKSFDEFANALYAGEVEAIIFDTSFLTQFEENHPNFAEETKILKSFAFEEQKEDISINAKVTSEPFTIYITGIDQVGSIGVRGRSDVNKVLTINPITHQILVVDIPRDYYIPQTCQYNQKDKLTHTGIFGVDCTVKSVSEYMGIDINYYVRVNFSSLENIVDALGGIDVHADYAFKAWNGVRFSEGINHLDGKKALIFCRERKSLKNGDFDRIQNQTRVLQAMVNKAISPSIITNYLSVLEAISGTFQTNMSEEEINDLIKMQLNDMRGWNISSAQLNGEGKIAWTPANGFDAYVCIPDGTSLTEVLEKMDIIKNGGYLE